MTSEQQIDRFLRYLAPIVDGMARKQARKYHPCLSHEDMCQRALEVCVKLWRQCYDQNPAVTPEQLYPIAVATVKRRLWREVTHHTKNGEREALRTTISLDASTGIRGRSGARQVVGDVLRVAPLDATVGVPRLIAASQVLVYRRLTPRERRLLQALIDPPEDLVQLCVAWWGSDEKRRLRLAWPVVRTRALAEWLGWTVARVRQTERTLFSAVRFEVGVGYKEGVEVQMVCAGV